MRILLVTACDGAGGVAATLNVVLHATTVLAWITAAFDTLMTTLLIMVLFQVLS